VCRAPQEPPGGRRSAGAPTSPRPGPEGPGRQFRTSGGAGSFADDLCKGRGIV